MSSFPARAAKAALRPLNMAPVALGVATSAGLLVAGLAPVAVLVGGLSMATYGAMVLFDAASPPPAPPPRGPDRAEIASLRLRKALVDVDRAAARVVATLDGHDGAIGPSLVEVRADCDALVEQATELARRGDAAHRALTATDPAELERDAQARLAAARATADSEAARAHRQAAEARRRQLEHWTELRRTHDRVEAELGSVVATLDELQVRLVRLTLQDPALAVRDGADASREMKALRERVGILERSARLTLEEVG
jgi:hypothetical protein